MKSGLRINERGFKAETIKCDSHPLPWSICSVQSQQHWQQ